MLHKLENKVTFKQKVHKFKRKVIHDTIYFTISGIIFYGVVQAVTPTIHNTAENIYGSLFPFTKDTPKAYATIVSGVAKMTVTPSLSPTPTISPTPKDMFNSDTVTITIEEDPYYFTKKAFVKAFGKEQWVYAEKLINQESGFNPYSVNQSSKACGMFQALPCSKVGGKIVYNNDTGKLELEKGSFKIEDHIAWAIEYIKNRYGTPKDAWNYHLDNNWY